jgi:hypothetical protein
MAAIVTIIPRMIKIESAQRTEPNMHAFYQNETNRGWLYWHMLLCYTLTNPIDWMIAHVMRRGMVFDG